MSKLRHIVVVFVLGFAMVAIARATPSSDSTPDKSVTYGSTPNEVAAKPKIAPATMPASPLRPNDPNSIMNCLTLPTLQWNLAWNVRVSKDGQVTASGTNSQTEQRTGLNIPEPATVVLLMSGAFLQLCRKSRGRR